MGKFLEEMQIMPLDRVAKISKLPEYVLTSGFAYVTDYNFNIVVPTGYISDLASFPWPIRNWFKSDNKRWAQAAILHDYLCSKKAFPRKYSDKIFLEAMKSLNNPWHIARAMYYAVRLRSVYLEVKKSVLRT